MLTLEPERLKNRPTTTRERIRRRWKGFFTRDAQAACAFSFSASKFSPFFHRVNVMAAILRANVRRAMVGWMPLGSDRWQKSWNGPGRTLARVAAALDRPFRT